MSSPWPRWGATTPEKRPRPMQQAFAANLHSWSFLWSCFLHKLPYLVPKSAGFALWESKGTFGKWQLAGSQATKCSWVLQTLSFSQVGGCFLNQTSCRHGHRLSLHFIGHFKSPKHDYFLYAVCKVLEGVSGFGCEPPQKSESFLWRQVPKIFLFYWKALTVNLGSLGSFTSCFFWSFLRQGPLVTPADLELANVD